MKIKTPNLQRLDDKSFTITFNFSPSDISLAESKVLTEIQKNFSLKGFRTGKVPLNLVKQNIDSLELIEHTLTDLLNQAYPKIIADNQLNPIVDPKISILNPPLKPDSEWQIKLESCEIPEIKIKPAYQAQIKKLKTKEVDQIIDVIIKNSTVVFPQILLDAELNRHLSKIIDQTQQAGISFDDYLKSKNTTTDQHKQEITGNVKNEWTINLAINKLSVDNHITPSADEIKEYNEKHPQYKTNYSLVNYLLTQQKVLDFLKNL